MGADIVLPGIYGTLQDFQFLTTSCFLQTSELLSMRSSNPWQIGCLSRSLIGSDNASGQLVQPVMGLSHSLDAHLEQCLSNTCFLTSCLLYTSDAADERSSVDLG